MIERKTSKRTKNNRNDKERRKKEQTRKLRAQGIDRRKK